MSHPHIIFCAAVPQEVKSLCKRLQISVPTPNDPVTFGRYSPFNITILTSGVGIHRMMERLQQVQPMTPAVWISYGFAGALSDRCGLKECFVGNRVQYFQHDEIEGTYPCKIECCEDILLCHSGIASTPEQKAELHQTTGASLVDMESYAVAVMAAQREDPFLWLRGISDAHNHPLSEELLHCLDANGYPSMAKSAGFVLKRLSLLPTAIQLAKITNTIQKELSLRALHLLDRLNDT